MGYVIDFSNEKYPRYILRLRGTPNGIIDLAGKCVISNHNVDYTSTPSTLGSGTALVFNGVNSYLGVNKLEKIGLDDFTISIRVVSQNNSRGTNASAGYPYGNQNSGFFAPFVLEDPLTPSDQPHTYILFESRVSPDVPDPQNTLCIYNRFSESTWNLYKVKYTNILSLQNFHLAIVRKDRVMKVAVNGNFIYSSAFDNIFTASKRNQYIGRFDGTSAQYRYSLYTLDDYCIIKGKALWTSDFTPPTTYLPDNLDEI